MSLTSFSPHATTNAKRSNCLSPDEESIGSSYRYRTNHPLPGQLYIQEIQQVDDCPPQSSSPSSPSSPPNAPSSTHQDQNSHQHLYVLPVLLLEFLAIALTRAVLPSILLQEYGSRVYLVLGCADCIRGLLAFIACPLFGKLSDIVGRRVCLLVTVIGSCAPVCSLALFSWEPEEGYNYDTMNMSMSMHVQQQHQLRFLEDGGGGTSVEDAFPSMTTTATTNAMNATLSAANHYTAGGIQYTLPPMAIPLFVVLLSLSGIFSSTFTLVFAYISDTVRQREERVSAYGLALATFGLSFTIGPMAGGYLAQVHTQYVFVCSLFLTILDVLYIYFILPESLPAGAPASTSSASAVLLFQRRQADMNISWSPWESTRLVLKDPFLRRVAKVAFFYYTGLWAVISTLSLYAVQHFQLSPERLGELMSAYGLCTMVAEAVLVRVMVPLMGEKRATRLGLLSFAAQCLVLGAAYQGWHLFVCVAFSLLGNLVYPSLSSLVAHTVEPKAVGEALGAINGVKALTEGIGPLFFGALMTISEDSAFPGWPYWIASLFVLIAYQVADELPDENSDHDEYIHELEFKQRRGRNGVPREVDADVSCLGSSFATPTRDDQDEEYKGLLFSLSEIEESSEDEYEKHTTERTTRLPTTPFYTPLGGSSKQMFFSPTLPIQKMSQA
jgi:MFS family permease